MSEKPFEGKRAIVTGAAGGIGRASALLFAARGAKVTIADSNGDGLAETLRMLREKGGEGEAKTCDCGSDDDVAALIDGAVSRFGGLDIIHANAGISGGRTPMLEQTAEFWSEILRVNLIGPFLAIKHGAPRMIENGGGAIVCTASVAGLRANAGGAAYSASKAGVISLVQTAANALTGENVRVNAVCPGLTETPMVAEIFRRARERGTSHLIGQLNPLQRAGQPEEVAEMACFLASDAASYVNGQAVAVDGGLSSAHPFAPTQQR